MASADVEAGEGHHAGGAQGDLDPLGLRAADEGTPLNGSAGTAVVAVSGERGGDGGGKEDELGSGHVVDLPVEKAPAMVGNTILLFSSRSNHYDAWSFPMKCIVGPDWPCLSYTFTLIVVPNVLFLMFIANEFDLIWQVIAYIVFIFAFFSLCFTACSDPGILQRHTAEWALAQQAAGKRGHYCSTCHAYKRPGTVHCIDCNVCVEELDHHCPWTGKCIGKNNLQYFYTFLGAILANLIYVIGGTFIHMGA